MESASKDEAVAVGKRRRAKKAYIILGVGAVMVAGIWFGHRRLTAGKQSTDDAQIEADVVPLSARVGGVIKTARVHDNQAVNAGDVLFELDPADLDVEVERTEAELDAARAQLRSAIAQVAIVKSTSSGALSQAKAARSGAGASVRGSADSVRAAEAAVARAKADHVSAQAELERTQKLVDQNALTRRDLEHAQQARDVAKASVDSATAQLDAAREQRRMAQSRVDEAEGRVASSAPVDEQVAAAEAAAAVATSRVKAGEVAVTRAKLNRSYATVVAPVAGTISKLGAHPGQAVMANQALLMLVPAETYIVANFKESQIAAMKVGDPADVELDAYGDTFHGVVEAISPATGSRFSLIPPDNATGNFVKVVQRVPVKIRWTTPPTAAMRPGLSAEVTV
ncbi:MAG: HlyD family secretion protein, partial [Kofleriaceae bacterium]